MKRHLTATVLVAAAVFGSALSASATPIESTDTPDSETPRASFLEEAKHKAMTGEDLGLVIVEVLPSIVFNPPVLKKFQLMGRDWFGPYEYAAFAYHPNVSAGHSDQLIEGIDLQATPRAASAQADESSQRPGVLEGID